MLARKDWIAQVTSLNNTSTDFQQLVKVICPTFNHQHALFGTNMEANYSDNSIIQFRYMENLHFGKILSVQNSEFSVKLFNGRSLLACVSDDQSIPGDLRHGLNLLDQHPSFGIRVLGVGDTVHIEKSDIIAQCCKFSDNSYDYLFSLDFKCPGK
jgi:hypothetical protein